jgi:hypothetical protein
VALTAEQAQAEFLEFLRPSVIMARLQAPNVRIPRRTKKALGKREWMGILGRAEQRRIRRLKSWAFTVNRVPFIVKIAT